MRKISPGATWRIKHDAPPSRRGKLSFGSTTHSLYSADYPDPKAGKLAGPRFPIRTIIDEVVISPWLHVEQMDTRTWFVELCGKKFMVTIGKNGVPIMGEWYE
jgi:hypothetical protein